MFNIIANIAKVGSFKIKAINSLVHNGPYLAVYLGVVRVAWMSFRTKKCTLYDGVGKIKGLDEVEAWLADIDNYNEAAAVWNSFQNGVSVALLLKKEETK